MAVFVAFAGHALMLYFRFVYCWCLLSQLEQRWLRIENKIETQEKCNAMNQLCMRRYCIFFAFVFSVVMLPLQKGNTFD